MQKRHVLMEECKYISIEPMKGNTLKKIYSVV